MSATLENEADPTFENEATGSLCFEFAVSGVLMLGTVSNPAAYKARVARRRREKPLKRRLYAHLDTADEL